jgi:hypothetical protein
MASPPRPRFRAIVPVAGLALLACAGSSGPMEHARSSDGYDRAYAFARRRQLNCPVGAKAACCEELGRMMKDALAQDDMATAANALSGAAMFCSELRASAMAALDHQPKQEQVPDAAGVTVRYAIRGLSATDRIYWAATYLDGRRPVQAAIAAGDHFLETELHLMTSAGTDDDALFRLQGRKDLSLDPRQTRTFVVKVERRSGQAGAPFTLDIVEEPPDSSAPIPARFAQAAVFKQFKAPLLPAELFRGQGWSTMLKICVDEIGLVENVTSVSPPPHPRHLGVLLNAFAHASYHPYLVDNQARRFCYPARINITPRS